LTGMLDDGTAGLMVVSASGGKAIVQDPDTALYPGMPRSALDNVPAARVATLQDIPALLVQLIGSPVPAGTSRLRNVPFGAAKETRIAELDMNEITSEERASNTEANSRILRDFLLRVNTAETIDSDDAPHSLDESPESSSA
jgi:two-component system chemotaxis response regulator CheB